MSVLPQLLTGRSLIACTGYYHGLGNRIRVVLGSKILAELENRDFCYVWPTGPKFGPALGDLWTVEDRVIGKWASKALSVRYPYRDAGLDWLDDAARRERIWQIRTSHALHLPPAARSWQEDFRAMRPVEQISRTVHTFFDRHLARTPYVGVMIRAHAASHAKTLQSSPINWYLARMRQIREHDPETRFFISCDVPEVQRDVIAQLGNSFGLDDKGAYNTVEGIRSAVADLYLLAGSGHLLGPHYSSFVEMAQFLAGPRLVLETAGTAQMEGRTDYASIGLAVDPTRPWKRS